MDFDLDDIINELDDNVTKSTKKGQSPKDIVKNRGISSTPPRFKAVPPSKTLRSNSWDDDDADSDVSKADLNEMQKTLGDADDMDSALFSSKRMNTKSPKTGGSSAASRSPSPKRSGPSPSPSSRRKPGRDLFDDDDADDILELSSRKPKPIDADGGTRRGRLAADEPPSAPARSALDRLMGGGSAKAELGNFHKPPPSEDDFLAKLSSKSATDAKSGAAAGGGAANLSDDIFGSSYMPSAAAGERTRRSDRESASPLRQQKSFTAPTDDDDDWLGVGKEIDISPPVVRKTATFAPAADPAPLPPAVPSSGAGPVPAADDADDWLSSLIAKKKQVEEIPPPQQPKPPVSEHQLSKTLPIASTSARVPDAAGLETRPTSAAGLLETPRHTTLSSARDEYESSTALQLSQQIEQLQRLQEQERQRQQLAAMQRDEEKRLVSQLNERERSQAPKSSVAPPAVAAGGEVSMMSTVQEGQLPGYSTSLVMQVRRLEAERDTLELTLDQLKRRHQLERQADEETFGLRERRLRDEISLLGETNEARLRQLEELRAQMASAARDAAAAMEREKEAEIERLRALHRRAIETLSREHDEALTKLKRAKDNEVEVAASAHEHTRSMQHLVQQLHANTKDLGQLQHVVHERHVSGFHEQNAGVEAKEQHLKILERRLEQQQEEVAAERNRLQQTLARMDLHVTEQSKQLEQEKWSIRQEQQRLETERVAAREEKRAAAEYVEREKAMVIKSKEEFLAEQKKMLGEIFRERRVLNEERSRLVDRTEPVGDQSAFGHGRSVQEQMELEFAQQAIQEDRAQMVAEQASLRTRLEQLRVDERRLQQERSVFDGEREKLARLAEQLRTRSESIDKLCTNAAEAKQRGEEALALSKKREQHLVSREQQLQEKAVALTERHKLLGQERMVLAREFKQLEAERSRFVCRNCATPVRDAPVQQQLRVPLMTSTPYKQQGKQRRVVGSAVRGVVRPVSPPPPTADELGKLTPAAQQLARDLAPSHASALQTDTFLEEEKFYLEALKHFPYSTNSSTNTDSVAVSP